MLIRSRFVCVCAAAFACVAVAACSNDDGSSAQGQQNAADRSPQLPGASLAGARVNAQQAPLLAQGFDTPQPSAANGGSAARPLLPPVFHTAD